MSRIPVARPIPVGLLVTDGGPKRSQRPNRLSSWLRSAAVAAAFGAFALASTGLTVAGFRPVSQTITETAFLPIAESPTELALPDARVAANTEEPADYIEPGEARPSLAKSRTSSPVAADVELTKTEPIAIPKRMKQGQTNQCGTAIDFVRSQSIAFDRAAREQKLVMVLHVAGNFEDPGFT